MLTFLPLEERARVLSLCCDSCLLMVQRSFPPGMFGFPDVGWGLRLCSCDLWEHRAQLTSPDTRCASEVRNWGSSCALKSLECQVSSYRSNKCLLHYSVNAPAPQGCLFSQGFMGSMGQAVSSVSEWARGFQRAWYLWHHTQVADLSFPLQLSQTWSFCTVASLQGTMFLLNHP